jgi:hypothetical protein
MARRRPSVLIHIGIGMLAGALVGGVYEASGDRPELAIYGVVWSVSISVALLSAWLADRRARG